MSARISPWRSLLGLARLLPIERRKLIASTLLAFAAVLTATGLLTASGYLISRAAQHPDILRLAAVIVAVRAFGMSRALFRYGERLVSHDLALRVLARLRLEFFRTLAPLVPGALLGHTRGDLLARFVGDVDTLQDLYLRALAPPIVAVLTLAAASFCSWIILPAAALPIFLVLLIAATVVPLCAGAAAVRAGRRQAAARGQLTTQLVEAIEGGPELAIAGRGHDRVATLADMSRTLERIAGSDALAAGATTALASVCSGAAILAVLLVGIPAVRLDTISGVWLAALVFLAIGVFEGITPLPQAARRLRGCAAAAARLAQFADAPLPVNEPASPIPLPANLSTATLRLDHVRFAYPGGREVLNAIDLVLESGARVLLTGPSGAGKTTLAHLLTRFIDPSAGTVTLNGTPLSALCQADVRATVLLVAQDAHLFNTSIRENLLLARRDANDNDIWQALKAMRLDTWVAGLPSGLDTILGEDGELVSGGQRRRLTLARALLSTARFLILDEPTVQLDQQTASEVMRAVNIGAGDRALLVISHRDEGLAQFERIELSNGSLMGPLPAASAPNYGAEQRSATCGKCAVSGHCVPRATDGREKHRP